MRVAIHWFWRDLRLADSIPLAEATSAAAAVVPVFVINPRMLGGDFIAPARVAAMCGALSDLAAELERQGGRLIVRIGETAEELASVAAEVGAEAVYTGRAGGSRADALEAAVLARLAADGRALRRYDDIGIVPPDALLTRAGTCYTVYSPYARRWRELVAIAPPAERRVDLDALRAGAALTRSLAASDHERALRSAVPDLDRFLPRWGGGRAAHLRRLRDFVSTRLGAYATMRDMPAQPGTSALSPAFRWGTIAHREALRAARSYVAEHPDATKGTDAWIGELAWSDFYRAILAHFPESEHHAFKSAYDDLPWPGVPEHAEVWAAGRTGYPLVDAGMRQLLAEGWMHNRLRMIVASFLVKDLLLDWHIGERHFLRHLADGDVAQNVGGWQWAASTGTDAQPYFRIFNPVSQSQRFDPDGVYICRYVPELAGVPVARIHAPWLMTAGEQHRAGCVIGRDYPAPIVDHAAQRQRALALFKARPSSPVTAYDRESVGE